MMKSHLLPISHARTELDAVHSISDSVFAAFSFSDSRAFGRKLEVAPSHALSFQVIFCFTWALSHFLEFFKFILGYHASEERLSIGRSFLVKLIAFYSF